MKVCTPTVVVIGLGYVGLPLAVTLARSFETWGLDIDIARVRELEGGHDRTGEVGRDTLAASSLRLTCERGTLPPADFYIVTVPTPVDSDNRPDLDALIDASRTVAQLLEADRRPIVVYESTVYPGVTENICAPELERYSGLTCGEHFFVAYSSERINPGDREHTINKVTKVVSGQTPEVIADVTKLYEAVTMGGVFKAASIKTAEAAKVIENAQRDLNIAFVNEVSQIVARLDVSVWDVLEAAGTKWNFLPFQPGLVGGHCVGVDTYYLTFLAEQLGFNPQVLRAGRSTNDAMAAWTADRIHKAVGSHPGTALVLGLTFKEDVPDIRNSKVFDLVAGLTGHGHSVSLHDPHADANEVRQQYGLSLDDSAFERRYDLVIVAVAHSIYRSMGALDVAGLVTDGGVLADFKNCFGGQALPAHVSQLWRL